MRRGRSLPSPGGRTPSRFDEHGSERAHLHVSEAWEVMESPFEVGAIASLGPHSGGVAPVVLADHRAELLRPLGHVPREAMERRPLAEDRVEPRGVHRRDLAGPQRPEPALQLQRTGERLLQRDLLVEDEADEKGERLVDEEAVGLVVAREMEAIVGHGLRRV